MRKLKCDFCALEVSGSSDKEVMDGMFKHLEKAHPTELAEMYKMPDEHKNKMMEETMIKIKDV
jgi:predicted small metal-binding protein